jgi:IMP dehydrogenase
MRVFQEAFTFDDVLLVPAHSAILPKNASLVTQLTRGITLNIPLVSAPMDTVTEANLAIALAQEGGIGILHKNMSIEDQAAQVMMVKKFESGIVQDPITISPNTTVQELLKLTQLYKFSGMPVVEGEQLVGIITNRDVRFETNLGQPVANLMTPKDRLVTVLEGASREEITHLLHKHRIEKILVINDQFQLRGMVTVKDMLKAKEKPSACKDESGRLRVGAAVGTSADTGDRVEALIQAGVDLIIVDTAHGHSQGVLDRIKWVKKHFPDVQLIGGNIATAEAALALKEAGVDGVKVGIGPGSICTTRVVAGVGIPQVSAIANVAAALKGSDISIIADGGIRFSGDICKAIVAGASAIMIGGLFAGTEEAPGEVVLYQGRSYKEYRGMGSVGAMSQRHGSHDRYFVPEENLGDSEKLVPEGIEGRVPYKGTLVAVIHQLMGGLRSGMGYTGCATIGEMRTKPQFVRVTNAGMRESHVHDVIITKEAPNYWIED